MNLLSSPSIKLPFGIHYSWLIVFALSIVQIFGTSISFSAGIMVAPLTNASLGFGWNVALVGAGIVASSKGAVCGRQSTGVELGRVEEALKLF